MSKKTHSPIDDDASYHVDLARKVELPGGVILLPRARPRVSGKVLKQIMDDVNDYRPVAASS